jgi:hypothetical protein
LKLKFVPLGSVLEPQEKQIVLDVGNRLEPGIIDHHQLRSGESSSTAELVCKHPNFVLDHLKGERAEDITWVLHEQPDFDAIASLFLAWHIVRCGYFPPGTSALRRYANLVDRGDDLLETAPLPDRTPYALFTANLARAKEYTHSVRADTERTKYGLEVMRYLLQTEASGIHALAHNECPHEHGFWHVDLDDDEDKFWRKDVHNAYERSSLVSLQIKGHVEKLRLLAFRDPQSSLFKVWARRHGFPLTVVFWSEPDKPNDMAIISVPGAYTDALLGLGRALEEAESRKREKLSGKERGGPPRWDDVDNNDPWYDGRSPAHSYTIVAAPRMGTVLTMEEIVRILKSPVWQHRPTKQKIKAAP